MASHARAFPKPGCGSISVNIALHRALELGLNRRTKNAGEPTDLQNELRKRAWWCIMTVVVAIYGKRGYPMPVSVQDFDVDFLEPVADELLSDDGVDRSRTLPCPYEMAICGHKIIPTVMEMYANLYSVRRDQSNYKTVVAALESQVEQWEAQLPDSMRLKGHKALDPGMVGPLFARCCLLELRLHIRHPSLAMTNDRAMIAENTRICEEMAREYLQTVELLSKMKALDTTWYQLSYYCVAILSMLFPRWERRFEITQEEIATLRGEMDRWMDIIKEMSSLLEVRSFSRIGAKSVANVLMGDAKSSGCGMGIGKQISQLIDRTMAWIEYDMKNKNMKHSSQGPADFKQEQSQLLQSALPQPGPGRQALNQSSSYPTAPGQHAPISSAGSSHRDGQAEAFYQTGASNNSSQAAFTSVAYVNQQTPATAHAAVPYQHEQPGLFYPPTATTVAPAQSPLPAQHDAVVHYGQPLGQQAPDEVWRSSWQDWSAAIAESQARLSANALLTLGGGNAGRNPVIAPVMTDSSMPHNGNQVAMVLQPAQWPLVMFEQPPQE
ncbi:hypothetical protein UVI_02017460 [Ustilaginoidea virens]|uniref:Xylanolytic transcriptional activator regulatory domain-containing protein n=1 Tax=Ustilaginoidea virens TaxID=1159556 RepID=A0A1B5KS21_USTVR|nr:hypothetical protein UVI_02017460 [Ustilaginoidea virens]